MDTQGGGVHLHSVDPNPSLSPCLQTMTSWGYTQAQVNLVTLFVLGTSIAMQVSIAHSIREATPTRES